MKLNNTKLKKKKTFEFAFIYFFCFLHECFNYNDIRSKFSFRKTCNKSKVRIKLGGSCFMPDISDGCVLI